MALFELSTVVITTLAPFSGGSCLGEECNLLRRLGVKALGQGPLGFRAQCG